MALQIQNKKDAKRNLAECDVSTFLNPGSSFTWFVRSIQVDRFRHISNLSLEFDHPVTAIAGANRSGKTSILLLMACSHERFQRPDATSSSIGVRDHGWNDVLSFTSHETFNATYQYSMSWRRAGQTFGGVGKRLHTSRAWSGLGKKSADPNRVNAKIRQREVRLVDLERLLPARAFSDSLFRKANAAATAPLHPDIAQAFAYIFDTPVTSIEEAGWHLNRRCFVIRRAGAVYSTYNAASGEEAVIYLLKDLIESPKNSLILIEEIEAGIHPSVLRKVLDIVHVVAWQDKKQVIFTTHSPTALSAVDARSRRFIEAVNGVWRCSPGISMQAASSKMDSVAHPLVQLYCEDDLAQFLITQQLVLLSAQESHIQRMVNVIPSGPVDQVKNDYVRHQRNFPFLRAKLGYCAVFDGDYRHDARFSFYHQNQQEFADFIYPFDKPEKFLVRAYLATAPHEALEASLQHDDHHTLFRKMAELGLATDVSDARNICYTAFRLSADYQQHSEALQALILRAIAHFTAQPD
ncbi:MULTISPECIES: ATP-dependent endonuclease [Comamonas]|uniref:ATP-dependent nuclease n=1 Tax=Comamonas TaxID=283 RepID=UPI00031404C7|nr:MULTISPECIES: AAA family ATPase [Comamonas]